MLSTLLEKCREVVHSRRVDHSKPGPPQYVLSKSDTATLLQLEDSWDDPGSDLRLAPEVRFLIGAGILWDLIDVNYVKDRATIVSRGSSPEGRCLCINAAKSR